MPPRPVFVQKAAELASEGSEQSHSLVSRTVVHVSLHQGAEDNIHFVK